MTKFRSAALTDIGRVRLENEDRFIHETNTQLFGVADGVGGLPGGAEASSETVKIIIQECSERAPHTAADLNAIVLKANMAVLHLGHKISPACGIGSTLTFACMRQQHFLIAHAGDSRAYLRRNEKLQCLTEDHTVENEIRRMHARGEPSHHYLGNPSAITRCIGQSDQLEVDISRPEFVAGDRYLFCTDGVTRMINDRELDHLMALPIEPEALGREIVQLAVNRGGPDNTTAVIVYIDTP
jgi:protein phosphatase